MWNLLPVFLDKPHDILTIMTIWASLYLRSGDHYEPQTIFVNINKIEASWTSRMSSLTWSRLTFALLVTFKSGKIKEQHCLGRTERIILLELCILKFINLFDLYYWIGKIFTGKFKTVNFKHKAPAHFYFDLSLAKFSVPTYLVVHYLDLTPFFGQHFRKIFTSF